MSAGSLVMDEHTGIPMTNMLHGSLMANVEIQRQLHAKQNCYCICMNYSSPPLAMPSALRLLFLLA
jgi:hypothetical protein